MQSGELVSSGVLRLRDQVLHLLILILSRGVAPVWTWKSKVHVFPSSVCGQKFRRVLFSVAAVFHVASTAWCWEAPSSRHVAEPENTVP